MYRDCRPGPAGQGETCLPVRQERWSGPRPRKMMEKQAAIKRLRMVRRACPPKPKSLTLHSFSDGAATAGQKQKTRK